MPVKCVVAVEPIAIDRDSHTLRRIRRLAGKTGTAQKVINGKYSNTSIITTFIGYFPADEPEYLIAIMFDEPKHGLWASTIAAPVFKNVAQSIYQISTQHYAAK